MTSTTSFRTIKSRLTSGIQSMTSNGYELKASRICVKRRLTHFFLSGETSNGNVWYSAPPSPPLIFYPTTEDLPGPVSCSDEEHRSIDSDEADESDDEQSTKQTKSRRLQKTRSYPQKDEPLQQQQRSSSNEDEENRESISRLNELNFSNRRTKVSGNRRTPQFTATTTTTTTTDEEVNKQSHLSSPIPTMVAPVRKVNRFQVKSIRKSQQPQILLGKAIAAKSSNEDDCSVPNESLPNLQGRPTIVKRSSADHPLETSENEHHRVRFLLPGPPATAVALPTPVPPCKEEITDDEEEEAVAKSPDQRFIKYASEIGRGAFKTVYRGLDTEASVPVAWCELQDFAQFDKHERARFKDEAEMLKKLQHQNIVRFYDFWEETNPRTNKKVIILVTELMSSGSLKSYIRKFKGQKEDKRINVMKKWCRQILKGLAYLHSRNPPVIHRDLKCDNVFITSHTGCVKIGDLGLATFKTQTFAKSMRGTMEFMAPEIFDEKYDELVDIYSFGLCMLEMITGEYPYIECKGPTAVIKRVTAGLRPDSYYKVENDDVREVIDCCIRTKKEERLSVHDLLQHSFFLEDNGLRIDLVRDSSADLEESIDFKLKIIDKAKRKALWTEHEAIRFRYNLHSDTPEQIADELIEKKYIFDDDRKFVIESIKDRVRALHYEQIDRQAGVFTRVSKATVTPIPPALPVVPPAPVPIPTAPSLIQPAQLIKPIPITPPSELSSAGSLQFLDAALKKTFNKNSTHPTANESSEPATPPVVNQEDSSAARLTQPSLEESAETQTGDLHTHLQQPPILSTPTSQSTSSFPLAPDSIKPVLPTSSSSVTETVENSHLPVVTSTGLSDTSATTPSQIPGSLKQLNALLTSTFKNLSKSSGTAQTSDTETSEESKRALVDFFRQPSISEATVASHSQPSTTSTIAPSSIQRNKSQPTTSRHPLQFDPLVSPEQLSKVPLDKSSSNDDTIVAAPSNDLSEIKSMIMDLSRTLLGKMTVIEKKIDEHRQHTQQINQLLNETVLPSLIDLSDIIHETSTNLDPRIRTKLDSIRTNIRSTQDPQSEIKDLMEI